MKGHVPNENMHEYRKLVYAADRLEAAAAALDGLYLGYEVNPARLQRLAHKYRCQADALRVDIPEQ